MIWSLPSENVYLSPSISEQTILYTPFGLKSCIKSSVISTDPSNVYVSFTDMGSPSIYVSSILNINGLDSVIFSPSKYIPDTSNSSSSFGGIAIFFCICLCDLYCPALISAYLNIGALY